MRGSRGTRLQEGVSHVIMRGIPQHPFRVGTESSARQRLRKKPPSERKRDGHSPLKKRNKRGCREKESHMWVPWWIGFPAAEGGIEGSYELGLTRTYLLRDESQAISYQLGFVTLRWGKQPGYRKSETSVWMDIPSKTRHRGLIQAPC